MFWILLIAIGLLLLNLALTCAVFALIWDRVGRTDPVRIWQEGAGHFAEFLRKEQLHEPADPD